MSEEAKKPLVQSAGFKIVLLGCLVVLLQIPILMVLGKIRERQGRSSRVTREVSQVWGLDQQLLGPVLAVPYERLEEVPVQVSAQTDSRPTSRQMTRLVGRRCEQCVLYLLPETLRIAGGVEPQVRYRGLFEVVVYETDLRFEGAFAIPREKSLGDGIGRVLWSEAQIALGVADVRGFQERVELAFDLEGSTAPQQVDFQPSPGLAALLGSGIHLPLAQAEAWRSAGAIPFSFDLSLRGSGELSFLPVATETELELRSSWPSPSFSGAFLPRQREVTNEGFSASWRVPHFGRSFPQFWRAGSVDRAALDASLFGVRFVVPADGYQQTERSVKYAVLFILLTFTAFFLLELLCGRRLHPMHYLLVGSSLCLFYLLLLAFCEHVGFGLAYVIASVATVLLIGGYARSVLRSGVFALFILLTLSALYSYLYVLLRLEDVALLMGAIGLFIILAIVMFVTRRLDWATLRFESSSACLSEGPAA